MAEINHFHSYGPFNRCESESASGESKMVDFSHYDSQEIGQNGETIFYNYVLRN